MDDDTPYEPIYGLDRCNAIIHIERSDGTETAVDGSYADVLDVAKTKALESDTLGLRIKLYDFTKSVNVIAIWEWTWNTF